MLKIFSPTFVEFELNIFQKSRILNLLGCTHIVVVNVLLFFFFTLD